MLRRVVIKSLLAGTLLVMSIPAMATAAIGIEEWDGEIVTSEQGLMRAGEHPDEVVNVIDITGHINSEENFVPDSAVRDLVADLPAGFIGAPNATPTCDGIVLLSPYDAEGRIHMPGEQYRRNHHGQIR